MTSPSSDLATFRTRRRFAASAAQMYDAFADPALLARWWGPDGFSNTFHVFEFETSGRWDFTMHGPDGREYANQCVFRELVPGEKWMIEHVCAPHFTPTVLLQPCSAATELLWIQTFDDASVAASVRHIVEPSNEQNLDRLEALLRSQRT